MRSFAASAALTWRESGFHTITNRVVPLCTLQRIAATHPPAHDICSCMPTGDSSQPLLASCAGDAEVRLHDLATGTRTAFNHHGGRVKKLVTEPGNAHTLISCSEDGTGDLCESKWHLFGVLLALERRHPYL